MIETQTIAPFPDGMNVQDNPWAIQDTQARWLQDVILDKPMEARRRGPVQLGFGPGGFFPTSITDVGVGIVSAIGPDDVFKMAVLHGTASAGSAKLGVLITNYTAVQDSDWGVVGHTNSFDPAKRYKYSTSSHPWGGTIIGTQINGANPSGTNTTIGHWYGASKPETTTGTITVAQDATAVTGSGTSWSGNIDPGTFLYAIADTDSTPSNSARAFIGIVKQVNSNTSLDLMEGALFAVTARAYRLRPIRPLSRRVAKGLITTTTTSATVTGSNTKFKRQKLDTPSNNGHWCIFRSDDMKFVGKVSSVESDISMTLTGNATIVCNKDKFVAIDMYDGKDLNVNTSNEPGWLTAQFAGRMWYGNRPASTANKSQPYCISRVWFSDIYDPEALDVTSDGDHLLIPSQYPPIKPLTAMAATTSALVCFKEDETYGVFGTDETNFSVRKILDDGAFDAMCVRQWNGGVVWAGQKGIWFFDGSEEPFNLIEDRYLRHYRVAVENHKNLTYKAWAFIYKDQYILYIEGASQAQGPVYGNGLSAGDAGRPTDYINLCINLNTRAVTQLTNVAHRGAVHAPFEEGIAGGTVYMVNRVNQNSPWAQIGVRLCNANTLMEGNGVDTSLTSTINPTFNRLGPNLFIESKRWDVGDPQRKKNFKQLQMLYRLQTWPDAILSGSAFVTTGDTTGTDYTGNYLNFTTIKGLNEYAIFSSSKWRPGRDTSTGVGQNAWVDKRIKFLKRSQHLGYRIFEERPGSLTFGVTAIDGTYSATNAPSNQKQVSKFTVADNPIKVPAVQVYMDGNGGGGASQKVRAVLYADNAGVPGILIAQGNEVTITSGAVAGYVRLPFYAPIDLVNATYWIGFIAGTTSNVARYWRSTTTALTSFNADTYSDGAADPFGSPTTAVGPMAVYAEYYQPNNNVIIGPMALGYKWLRPGRV